MKILYKFAIFLFILLPGFSALAQTERQVALADSLYRAGDYFDAITEYKRLIFFDEQKEYSFAANYRVAECYKAGARFADAVKYYRIAEQRASNKDERWLGSVGAARAHILNGQPQQALDILGGLESLYIDKRNELNYWKGWAFIFMDDWQSASNEFKNSDTALAAFTDSVANEFYSPRTAMLLSMIPGLGQIYTGSYLDAALSLGWNALWGYTSVKAFLDDRILDGLLVTNLLWVRFYRGGIENAENKAVEKNNKIKIEALNHLQKTFMGARP